MMAFVGILHNADIEFPGTSRRARAFPDIPDGIYGFSKIPRRASSGSSSSRASSSRVVARANYRRRQHRLLGKQQGEHAAKLNAEMANGRPRDARRRGANSSPRARRARPHGRLAPA